MDAAQDPGIEVRTYFARGRNAMIARAEFSELYAAMYLHRMDNGIEVPKDCDVLLRDALAAITLHCASRPRSEAAAWTVNFQSPKVNIFASGDNRTGQVIGNALTDNVRDAIQNVFYADTIEGLQPPRRSVIDFEGADFFAAAEKFYDQSEQRLARFFRYDEEDIVLITAQPDCDEDWLALLDEDSIKTLDKDVELSLLEQRWYRFECGCTQERMIAMLGPMMKGKPEDLFADDDTLTISCPRCSARRVITRAEMENYLATQGS